MGTRGLTCVVWGDEFKVAQYGQWDHYPSGQGVHILSFLRCVMSDPARIEEFFQRIEALSWYTEEELIETWKEVGVDATTQDNVPWDLAKKYFKLFPELSRDTGGKILDYIMLGDVTKVIDDHDFAADSLFCEWAYVIDLDAMNLEVHGGWQKEPHTNGRFAGLDPELPEWRGERYYPVTLLRTYSLDDLPSDEQFVLDLDPPEDDDE